MPIYEYVCGACDNRFEFFIRGSAEPACPRCGGGQLERLLSTPRVRSETTHGLAMRAAKKRDQSQAKDRMHERIKYEESHDRHG